METTLIIRRSGKVESFSSTKLQKFIHATVSLKPKLRYIDVDKVLESVKTALPVKLTSDELLKYVSETCGILTTSSYDYFMLGGRIEMNRLYYYTDDSFTNAMLSIRSILSDEFLSKIEAYDYSQHINSNEDFNYDIMGVRTLERSYLLKNSKGIIVERPQYMLMRVSVFLNDTVKDVLETYSALSKKYYTHASPTLFHSGMKNCQLASCFLMQMKDDSIDGIFDTIKDTALISKSAGGIGISVSNIRAKGSRIMGTNGVSNGLIPMLQVLNATARYVDQGGGKRKGSFAIYIEPWHADVESVVRIKLNTGAEEERARDLFVGLWVSDSFMRAVDSDSKWHLFCPTDVPQLQETWGKEFEQHYDKAVIDGKSKKIIRARDLWAEIVRSQIETGGPYMLFKDSCNRKSNQQHLGTIKSSNLCAEIIEYTSKDEVSVCTLASICLPKFVLNKVVDYDKIVNTARLVCRTLNKSIDKTTYPIEAARNSNSKHRPLGIGIQGLADVYDMMELPHDSEKANQVNTLIAESIYYGAMCESVELARKYGPHESFEGSPLSFGKFQFDLWETSLLSGRYDWDALRVKVMDFGARNSLLTAYMPTASTAQIMGNSESFEQRQSNKYVRRVLAGEFIVVNKHVERINRNKLGRANLGAELNSNLTSTKYVIDQAASRARFICQSQSLNLYCVDPNSKTVTSMLFYAWRKGLKTGLYYLRIRPKAAAIPFVTCSSCEA
jgi:ribonucleoside-diphosphate reductase alpha chain